MYGNVLRNRNFDLYFLNRVLSKTGTSISGIAFLLLVYNLTRSGIQTTGVALAETIPYVLFGLIGGVSADRLPKKVVLVSLDAIQGMILVATAMLYSEHKLTYATILAITFLVETAGCFYNPTSRALLPNIIRSEEKVPANSLIDISSRGPQLVGPAAAYFFLHRIGYGTFFLADGVSYLLSAGMLLFLHIPLPSTPSNQKVGSANVIRSVYRPIAEFTTFAWRTPDLRNLFISTTLVVFFNTWVWQIGLLLRTESLFPNGAQMYSLYLIYFTVFSIIVSLLLPLKVKALRIPHYMLGAVLWGLGIIGVGIVQSGVLIAVFIILVGCGMPIASLSRVFMLQNRVPDAMRGRAFSFSAVLLYFSNTVSLALFGGISHLIDVRMLFVASGIGIVLIACVYALSVKLTPLRRRHTKRPQKLPIER